jgi:hypothetical protein
VLQLEQQEQQVQTARSRPAMALQELKQLLQAKVNGDSARKTANAFSLWSSACGSTDVYVMLRTVDSLVQRLRGSDAAGRAAYAPSTAVTYMQLVAKALQELPELQQLLTWQQLQALQEELQAAKQHFAQVGGAAAAPGAVGGSKGSAREAAGAAALQDAAAVTAATQHALFSKAGSSVAAAAAAADSTLVSGMKRQIQQQQQVSICCLLVCEEL